MKYSGIAQEGEGRAGALGFPTVNIPLTDTALSGIYAARVTVLGKEYRAAVYANRARAVLEAHILDFTGTIYGHAVSITLLEKLRDDAQFATEDALKAAIAHDVHMVREYFNV